MLRGLGYRTLHPKGIDTLEELARTRHLKSVDVRIALALVRRMGIYGLVKSSVAKLSRELDMSPTVTQESLRRLERAQVFVRAGSRAGCQQLWVVNPEIASAAAPSYQGRHLEAWFKASESAEPIPEPRPGAIARRHAYALPA